MQYRTLAQSWSTRLAKAETVLTLALTIDMAIMPLVLSQVSLSPSIQTILKMALVLGLFGPFLEIVNRAIDGGLCATRRAATSYLPAPKIVAHVLIMLALFSGYYHGLHHRWPWQGRGYTFSAKSN